MGRGYKIVLTMERCLASDYSDHTFIGFCACAPKKGVFPGGATMFFRFLCPPLPSLSVGRALYAPYGTRKIEAALLDYGFTEDEVAVVPPRNVEKFVGPETKVVGITSNDPLGKGPATTTFSGPHGLIPEESFIAWKFRELVTNPALRRWGAKIVVGGPGAWQLEDPEPRRRLGIDVVVIGEGEKVVPPLFEKIINGEPVPEVVYGEVVEVDEMPLIRRPTICGIVEVARGCGKGCKFCIPTLARLRSRPLKDILAEVEVNVRGGKNRIVMHAEDVLRYKGRGPYVNREAVYELWKSVKEFEGVKGVAQSHFALSSVAQAPDLVEDISNLLGAGSEIPWISGQTGVETGSPRIIRMHMSGKPRPFKPEEWPDVVEQAFGICSDNHWVPCGTLIMGLPGETEDDVIKTIELMDRLRKYKSLIVPLFFVPIGRLKNEKGFGVEDMTEVHWELMMKCWEHCVTWIKELAMDYMRNTPFLVRRFVVGFVERLVKSQDARVREAIKRRMDECRARARAYVRR